MNHIRERCVSQLPLSHVEVPCFYAPLFSAATGTHCTLRVANMAGYTSAL